MKELNEIRFPCTQVYNFLRRGFEAIEEIYQLIDS